MDILLIEPPQSLLKGQKTNRGYSLGLVSLAAYLRANGIEPAVMTGDVSGSLSAKKTTSFLPGWLRANVSDLAAGQRTMEAILNDKSHPIWKALVAAVRRAAPKAVGIQYFTPMKYAVELIARLVREVDPEIKIIAGSFHPTACPEEVLQNPDIDFVVRGEGEIPLLGLMKEIKKDSPKWETVPGVSYRDAGGNVKSNSAAGLIADLDDLPFPARDLVLDCDYTIYPGHSLTTSRGCPYTCAFCSDRRLWGGKVRRRSVDNVLKEMKSMKDTFDMNYVDIVDGTFTYDRKYLEVFCNALIDQRLNVRWGCTARYDNLDRDILELMKRSNCYGLYLGLESGSDRVLRSIDKKETIERAINVSKLIHESGIISATSILLGTPDEEKEDIEATLEVMRHFKTDFFDINSYVPLPGTPLYDSMSEEEKSDVDWRKAGMKSFETHFTRHLSLEELNDYRAEAYEIANAVRRRSTLRLGLKMALKLPGRLFGG